MRNALILVFALATTIFANDSAPDKSQVQAITISTHGGGRDWGSDAIVPTLLAIRDLGANWGRDPPLCQH